MVPQCYVDGDVADWDTADDDRTGCEVAGLVVYLPQMGKKKFETWCDWLEYRAEARVTALLAAAAGRGGRLGVVDREAAEVADEAVNARFGPSYLEEFINDAAKVALENVGASFRRIAAMGVVHSPATAMEAVNVFPAKSFRNEKALHSYFQEGRALWRPSVRLTLQVSLDGRMDGVEEASRDLRRALSECGTLTEWKLRGRPSPHEQATADRPLRLVVG